LDVPLVVLEAEGVPADAADGTVEAVAEDGPDEGNASAAAGRGLMLGKFAAPVDSDDVNFALPGATAQALTGGEEADDETGVADADPTPPPGVLGLRFSRATAACCALLSAARCASRAALAALMSRSDNCWLPCFGDGDGEADGCLPESPLAEAAAAWRATLLLILLTRLLRAATSAIVSE
jgi:hypothetical protein